MVNPNKGRKIDRTKYPNMGHFQKHIPESIEKMRLSHQGRKDTRKGKTYEEVYGYNKAKLLRDKLRLAHLGQKHTKEQTEKIRLSLIGNTHGFKKGMITWNYIDGRSKNPLKRTTLNGMIFSHYIWCSQPENFYRVPKGMVIHHLDGNPLNNNPKNLLMMTDRDHRVFHNLFVKEQKKQEVISDSCY